MKITAVTPEEEKDDHNNNTQETGIFEIHTTKTWYFSCSQHKSSNMLLYFTTLLLIYLVTTLPQHCLATSSKATTYIPTTTTTPPPAYECGSKDIRNYCTELKELENCTVITGSLDIVLLPIRNKTCNFNQYQFKKLREITGFLIFHDVRDLKNITNIFPNLTVIRGQEVFLNYAFAVSAMDSLERLEFRSLIAIQRGHILVKSNPKLCNTEGIYWDRLTLTPGENHIFLENQQQCPTESKCNGCPTDYCWSDQVCQKLENDSVLSLTQDIHECHTQCLGGCYNPTAQGCVVCKSWTDHNTCVNECPPDKYASKEYLRCYTREECVKNKQLFIYKNTCVKSCPGYYKLNDTTGECDFCDGGINNCSKVCNSNKPGLPIMINHLMNVERLRGCQILNDTVVITIHNRIEERELVENLQDVREIMGHLKINRSPHLTSLKFFKNLEKIHGKPLENNQYSLIIYNNKNISELWPVKPGFELMNGGMFIHLNNKLCNRNIKNFREKVKHDNDKDSFQTSDQEVLCSPAKLNLHLVVHSHRSLLFAWPKEQTSSEVEIIYRPIDITEQFTEKSELDTEVCYRTNWRRELKFPHELRENSTHYTYIVQNLEPHTKYAGLVKTFGQEDIHHEARSEVKFAITKIDFPKAPSVVIKSKTYNSLTVEFQYENREYELVDYYMLQVYHIAEDKDVLDSRNYCYSYIMYNDYADEYYDDCCSRREEEKKDRLFLKQLGNEFSCSLDRKEYCEMNHKENNSTNDRKAIITKRLEHSENNYTVRSLERFNLYVIQVQACNHAGCGSYNMLSTRTNYSIAADKIYDMSACKVTNKNEYRVYFSEPKLPNAYITSYALHFRHYSGPNQTNEDNKFVCISRLEHERNNFLYVRYFNNSFNQAAVRVFSLGHQAFNDWIQITTCPTTKLAGKSSHGWNIFFIFFLIGAAGTLLWICYKRKYWRKIPQLRRYLPLHMGWRYLRAETDISEDRQILVDRFETVRFHNSPEDDMKYLVH